MRDLLSQIDPVRVSVGEVSYPPGGRLGPRAQHDVQLMLVHSGRAAIAVDDSAPVTYEAGTVVLLLPGHEERFAFAEDRPTHHSWVQVHLPDPPRGLATSLPLSDALAGLVRAAVEAARSPTAQLLVAALAAAALLRYEGEAESPPAGAVERARHFVHAHLADPALDLERIASAAHVSAPHLVRRFKQEVGVTPMAYLWERRVATGIDLLTHTGLPVGAVAARSGFKSVYHFSRRVKQHTGRSPTHLRRAV